MLTKADQIALLETCETQWKRIRRQLWRVYDLPSDEWDDIRTAAFARVLTKAERHYNPAKGGLDAWVYTVIRRVVMNALRPLLPTLPRHDTRTKVRHACPIAQRVVRDRWGAERVVTSPDMPAVTSTVVAGEMAEFLAQLDGKQRRVAMLLMAGHSVNGIGRRLRLDHWSQSQRLVSQLRERWLTYQSPLLPSDRIAQSVKPRMPDDIAAGLAVARAVTKAGYPRKRAPRPAYVATSDFLHLTPIP